jgi:hypothetical protein
LPMSPFSRFQCVSAGAMRMLKKDSRVWLKTQYVRCDV